MTVSRPNGNTRRRLSFESVVRVNEHPEPPVVGFRQLVAQGFEVAIKFGNVGANRPLGMTRARLTPIQVALVARIPRDGIEGLLIVSHCGRTGLAAMRG
jgi:hypothetical protein